MEVLTKQSQNVSQSGACDVGGIYTIPGTDPINILQRKFYAT